MPGMELSVREGDAVERRVGGSFVSFEELAALDVGSDLETGFVGSSVFFLPIPNRPRIFVFFPESSVFDTVPGLTAEACTLSPFCGDAGSKGSASVGREDWVDDPLWSGAVLARLMSRECSCRCRGFRCGGSGLSHWRLKMSRLDRIETCQCKQFYVNKVCLPRMKANAVTIACSGLGDARGGVTG